MENVYHRYTLLRSNFLKYEVLVVTEVTTTHLEGDHIAVELTREPGCQISLEVTVTPEATGAAYKKALKSVNKEVSIPGFRKGRAPDHLIIKQYATQIDQEWKELLLNTAFDDSVKLTNLYPLSRSSIKKAQVETVTLEEGAKIEISFEGYPDIPDILIEEITLEEIPPKEVTEEETQESIERLRESSATLEPVKDRGAQDGDTATITLEYLEGEETKAESSEEKYPVSKESMEAWMYDAVVGMKAEESKEIEKEIQEEGSEEKISKKYTLKVDAVEESVLPSDGAEFAKKVGLETFDELRVKITERLHENVKFEVEQKMYKQVEDILLEKFEFEVPASILEEERRGEVKQRILALKNEEKSDEDIKAQEADIEKDADIAVKRRLKLFFILQRVSDEHDIKISDEELRTKMRAHLYELMMAGWQEKSQEEKEGLISLFRVQLLEEKTKAFIVDQVMKKDIVHKD
jgi:trigger factor